MQSIVSRRRLLAGGSLGTLAALAGCLATGRGESEAVTETYDADAIGELSLSASDGSVTVEGAADANGDDALEIRGHKAAPTEDSLESLTVETTRENDRLTVETDGEDVPFLIGPDPKLDLEATVPDGVGSTRAETANGDVVVRDVTGEVVADTTNGEIDVETVDGEVDAECTNGSVEVSGVSGDVRAETPNGDVDVTLAEGDGDLTAESTNGSVTVTAPPSLDATVTAETTNGEVSIEGFDGATEGDDDVTLTLGDGSRRVRARTTNGSVTVRGDTEE